MKARSGYGVANQVGRTVERLRKEQGISQKDFVARLQVRGCDIHPDSYSRLEGQLRSASEKEIRTMAEILRVPPDSLYEEQD